MKNILVIVASFVFLVNAETSNKICRTTGEQYICKCDGTEYEKKSFEFSEEHEQENITFLQISSCTDVNLEWDSLNAFPNLQTIQLDNIRGTLNLDVEIHSEVLNKLEILNVSKIPMIHPSFFVTVAHLTSLRIENTTIEDLLENFNQRNVQKLVLKNVTIKKILSWMSNTNGTSLTIHNCKFQRVTEFLNFAEYDTIDISDSSFEMINEPITIKGGNMTLKNNMFGFASSGINGVSSDIFMDGVNVLVTNNVVHNASLQINASRSVHVTEHCGDGKSTMGMNSAEVQSRGNRLPNEIKYTSPNVIKRNNTICEVGSCKCHKSHSNSGNKIMFTWPCFVTMLLSVIIHKL